MSEAPLRGDGSSGGAGDSPSSPITALLLAAAAIAGYALASHWLMLHAASQPWAVLVLLLPLLAAAMALLARMGRLGAAAAVALLAAGVIAWRLIEPANMTPESALNRLYVAQHVGVHGLLLALFARSLSGPGLSLIGQLAQRVHALTPAMVAYTRSVTLMWCAYFAGMVLLSLAVYAFGSWPQWSLLANLGTPVAIAALFVGEYGLRYRLHPEFERTPLAVAVQAWRRRP
jgi:uncharacterized membrane protein